MTPWAHATGLRRGWLLTEIAWGVFDFVPAWPVLLICLIGWLIGRSPQRAEVVR